MCVCVGWRGLAFAKGSTITRNGFVHLLLLNETVDDLHTGCHNVNPGRSNSTYLYDSWIEIIYYKRDEIKIINQINAFLKYD